MELDILPLVMCGRQRNTRWRMQINEDFPHDASGGLPLSSMHNENRKTLLLTDRLDAVVYGDTEGFSA